MLLQRVYLKSNLFLKYIINVIIIKLPRQIDFSLHYRKNIDSQIRQQPHRERDNKYITEPTVYL